MSSVFRATMTSTDDQRAIALLGSVREVDPTSRKRGQAAAGDGPARKQAKCEHGRQKNKCKECGGSGICAHGRVKSVCKECGGNSICVHGRRKSTCKECGGCVHGRVKSAEKPRFSFNSGPGVSPAPRLLV